MSFQRRRVVSGLFRMAISEVLSTIEELNGELASRPIVVHGFKGCHNANCEAGNGEAIGGN